MFTAIRRWFIKALGGGLNRAYVARAGAGAAEIIEAIALDVATHIVPFDENLLERSRTQWQFGDWQSLSQLNRDTLQHRPDRAELALLTAAGLLQTGNDAEAKEFIRLAQDWGISKKRISQILIAGVHNSIGRTAAIGNQQGRALQHFQYAIAIGTPGADTKLLTQARAGEQLSQIGLTTPLGYLKVGIREILSKSISTKPSEPIKNTVSSTSHQALKTKNEEISSKTKYSDANIDAFLEDITPFFRNKLLLYVDVGAYVGEVFLKILSSKKLKIREAHLIEPNPASYQQLKKAVEACGISSCNTYHFGISNVPGIGKFRAAKSMTKKLSIDIAVDDANNIFEVNCHRMDDVANLFTDERINLLKLDVEGEELNVLRSANQLLTKQKVDVIYLEAGFNKNGTQQAYFGDLDAILQSYGYRVFKIYEQKNEWIDDSPVLRRTNVAYLSNAFAAANPFSATMKNTNY